MKTAVFVFFAACSSASATHPTVSTKATQCLQPIVQLALTPKDLIPGCKHDDRGMTLTAYDMQQLSEHLVAVPEFAGFPFEFDFSDDLSIDSEMARNSPTPPRYAWLSKLGVLILQQPNGSKLYRIYKERKGCVLQWRLKLCRESGHL
jgi:hypothetical protein